MYVYGSRARAILRASVHRAFASMSGMQRTESFDLRHVFQEQRGQIDSSRQHYPPVPFPQPRKRGRPRKIVVTSTKSAPMKKTARVLSRAEDQEHVQDAYKITMNGKNKQGASFRGCHFKLQCLGSGEDAKFHTACSFLYVGKTTDGTEDNIPVCETAKRLVTRMGLAQYEAMLALFKCKSMHYAGAKRKWLDKCFRRKDVSRLFLARHVNEDGLYMTADKQTERS